MLSFCLFFSFKRLPWQPAQYSRLPPSIFWYPVVFLTYLAWWHNSIRKVFFEQLFDTLMPDYLANYVYMLPVDVVVMETSVVVILDDQTCIHNLPK